MDAVDAIILIIKIAALFAAIILLVSSFIRLFRWRRAAFSSTNAYLKNSRHIRPFEKVCIQAPDDPGVQYVCSGKSSKESVYFEYWYTVDGKQYCKSYFFGEDESEPPYRIKMYYNTKNPKMAFREGEAREGVIISIATIILGALCLFASIASFIW